MGTVNRRAELLRSLKFTLFSASAGLIQIGAFALCNDVIRLPAWLGYLIALVLSVLWNFTLNRRYTFRSAASVPRAMALVALFYLVFTPCTTWLEHWLTDVKLWNDYLVTALNMVLNLVLEFLYDRFAIEDSYYQFLQYMNKLYREGLIDPNSFVQEEVDIQAKGKEGKVGTLWVGSYIDIMVGDRGDEYEYFLPLENAEGKRTYVPNKFSGDVNPNRFIVTKNCEYPAAMVRLYDYLNSSFENKLLFDWGPEGEAWEKTEDGKILRLNADLPEGFSSYAEVRHTLSMGVLGPILWDDADQAEFAITNDRDVEYYARRDPLMEYAIDDKDQIPVGQDTVENSQEAAVLITEIRTYMDNFQSEAIMKGIDDAKWQKHLEDVQKYDITRYVEIKQAFYDRMMELLGG